MCTSRWVIQINVRRGDTSALMRTCDLVVVATTPERAMGHRAVWDAHNTVTRGLGVGAWYTETWVRREEEVQRA